MLPSRPATALVAALTVLGAALRVPRLRLGLIANEFGMLPWQRGLAPLWDGENGVNPPLLRLLLAQLDPAWALDAGRILALVCGILLIPVLARLSHRASGSDVALVVTALLVAVSPKLVVFSAISRVYSPAALLLALHLDALVQGLREPSAPDGWSRRWLVTACLLPWLHYTFLPLLAAEAAVLAWLDGGWRDRLRAAWPFALAVVPLVTWILFFPGGRSPTASLGPVVAFLLDLGTAAPGGAPLRMAVAASLIAGAAAWPFTTPGLRALWAWSVATTLLALGMALEHWVRPPTVIWLLVPFLPWVAGVAASPRGAAWPLTALLLAFTLPPSVQRLQDPQHEAWDVDAVPELAARWDELVSEAAGRPIWLTHAGHVPMLYHQLTGEHLGGLDDPAVRCGRGIGCFVFEGVQVRERPSPASEPGLYAVEDRVLPAEVPDTCTRAARWEHLTLWDCRASSAPDATPSAPR